MPFVRPALTPMKLSRHAPTAPSRPVASPESCDIRIAREGQMPPIEQVAGRGL